MKKDKYDKIRELITPERAIFIRHSIIQGDMFWPAKEAYWIKAVSLMSSHEFSVFGIYIPYLPIDTVIHLMDSLGKKEQQNLYKNMRYLWIMDNIHPLDSTSQKEKLICSDLIDIVSDNKNYLTNAKGQKFLSTRKLKIMIKDISSQYKETEKAIMAMYRSMFTEENCQFKINKVSVRGRMNINEVSINSISDDYNIPVTYLERMYVLAEKEFRSMKELNNNKYFINRGIIHNEPAKDKRTNTVKWVYNYKGEKRLIDGFIEQQRALLTPGLRYDIISRDRGTCQLCGKTAPNIRIEVDHIKPVSLGGETNPSNLRVLCTICNRGKSAKYNKNGHN